MTLFMKCGYGVRFLLDTKRMLSVGRRFFDCAQDDSSGVESFSLQHRCDKEEMAL